MPDRENVIKTLGKIKAQTKEIGLDKAVLAHKFMDEIMNLLKEQEAVKPIAKEDDTYECICGAIVGWDELDASGIVQTRFNYCPYCGKAVKWK